MQVSLRTYPDESSTNSCEMDWQRDQFTGTVWIQLKLAASNNRHYTNQGLVN